MAKVWVGATTSHWEADSDENKLLHEFCSAEVKSRWHHPSFQNGSWDGFVRLYSVIRKTMPSGLVPEAAQHLREAGFDVEENWQNVREFASPRPAALIDFELADHQLRCVEAMMGSRRGIIHAATNAGKTKIAEAWCALNDCKAIYLVPSKELLTQTYKSFKEDTNLHVGKISAGEEWSIGDDVTVCLVSSISKRKDSKTRKLLNVKTFERFAQLAPQFEAAIVDEAHHVLADTWKSTLRLLKNCHYRFGMTGTPWEKQSAADALKVKAHLGPILASVTNAELIDKGWSATPTIFMIPVDSLSGKKKETSYAESYEEAVVYNDLRNNMICKLGEMLVAQEKNCLVIADRLDQISILERNFKIKNLGCRVVTGQTEKEIRRGDFIDFRDRKFPILISNVMSEGVDIPSLNAVIFAGGGKGSKKILQRVGRGLRKKKGSNVVEIYDFDDRQGEYLKAHANSRKRIYKEEGFEIKDFVVRF